MSDIEMVSAPADPKASDPSAKYLPVPAATVSFNSAESSSVGLSPAPLLPRPSPPADSIDVQMIPLTAAHSVRPAAVATSGSAAVAATAPVSPATGFRDAPHTDVTPWSLVLRVKCSDVLRKVSHATKELFVRPVCVAAILADKHHLLKTAGVLPPYAQGGTVVPDTPEAVLRRPKRLLALIRQDPANAALAKELENFEVAQVHVGLTSETVVRLCLVLAKDETAATAATEGAIPAHRRRLEVFVKTPHTAKHTLFVRSRQCVWDDARELSFYEEVRSKNAFDKRGATVNVQLANSAAPGRSALSPLTVLAWFKRRLKLFQSAVANEEWQGMQVPLAVPTSLVIRRNMWVGKQLLVLEMISHADYGSISDWSIATLPQCRLMVTRIGRFHAANWVPKAHVAPFLTDRTGREFLRLSKAYAPNHPSRYFEPLVEALEDLLTVYCRRALDSFSVEMKDGEEDAVFPLAKRLSLLRGGGEAALNAALRRWRQKRIPVCIAHGDMRLNHCLFSRRFLDGCGPEGPLRFKEKSASPRFAYARDSPSSVGTAAADRHDERSDTPQPISPASPCPPTVPSAGMSLGSTPGALRSQPSPAEQADEYRMDPIRYPVPKDATLNSYFDTLPDDSFIATGWSEVCIAPFLWDYTYTTVLSLPLSTRREVQTGSLLDVYLRELTVNCLLPPTEIPSREMCVEWIKVLNVAVLLRVWAMEMGRLLVPATLQHDELVIERHAKERWTRVVAAVMDSTREVEKAAAFLECDPFIIKTLRTEISLFGAK
jgi:hypothetical protein